MTFNLQTELGSSDKASVEGVWVTLGGDAMIKVSRVGHPEAMKAYKRLPKHVRFAIETSPADSGTVKDYLVNYMVDHVLRDWKHLADGFTKDGQDKMMKFSQDNARMMLKKHRRFRERVWEIANDEDFFNVEDQEEVKN